MARVTVEDCLEKIPNRFELIHIASKRVRQLAKGSKPTIANPHNKAAVVALREIANGGVAKAEEEPQPVEPQVAEETPSSEDLS